jgi:hypothetical protein
MFEMRCISKNLTAIICIKTIFTSLVQLIMCFLEKDVGKKNSTKAFIGLIGIFLGNTYKNYVTIELVFSRAGDAIRNFTELLDLNFNVIQFTTVAAHIGYDKSTWLKTTSYHLEIDEKKGKSSSTKQKGG